MGVGARLRDHLHPRPHRWLRVAAVPPRPRALHRRPPGLLGAAGAADHLQVSGGNWSTVQGGACSWVGLGVMGMRPS